MDQSQHKSAFVFVLVSLILGAVFCAGMVVNTTKARAGDLWNGCGLNAHGSIMAVNADVGSGFFVGTNGQTLGASALCDVQMGKTVVGGFVEYDRFFGNAYDVGLRSDLTVGARAGYLFQPTTLLYVHGGRAWYETTGPSYQGWKLGVGSELRLPTVQPLFLDVRYTHHMVENTGGVDVTGDSLRVGLTLKFGAGLSLPQDTSRPLK